MLKVLIGLFCIGVFMVSCQNETPVVDKSGNIQAVDTVFVVLDSTNMNIIELSEYELNLSIRIPIVETATGIEIKPEIIHDDGDYLWYIKVGDYFNLVIEDYAKEFNKVANEKQLLMSQNNMFDYTFIIDQQKLLFYKRVLKNDNGGKETYHCFSEIKIDGYNYVLRSEKTGSFKLVIQDMVTSIQTAKGIKKT